MYAMQYEVGLPADYDMTIIRHRVAQAHRVTDDFTGLAVKAYAIRERGVAGSPVNEYAPFYLWRSTEAMGRFLWGGFFSRIVDSFGRVAVRHWTGAGVLAGPAYGAPVAAASRAVAPVPGDPAGSLPAALDGLRERAAAGGVHSTWLAVDPLRWELVRFTLWAGPAAADETRYTVLHTSTPEMDQVGFTPVMSAL